LWLHARQAEGGNFVHYLHRQDLSRPDLTDMVDELQTHEFFHPAYYRYIGELYLSEARFHFTEIDQKLPSLKAHLTYAHAYILVMLDDFPGAKRLLEGIPLPEDKILRGCWQVMLGRCHFALDHKNEAGAIWAQVDTQQPILAAELALAYARHRTETGVAAELAQQALEKMPEKDSLEVYPPFGAFAGGEVYRRAGNTFLLLGKEERGDTSIPQANIIEAMKAYKISHVEAYPYVIDEPPWGNDPSLLVNMAYASYKRGFTFWSATTETFSVMQQWMADLYPLHIMIQKIYAVHMVLHQDIRQIDK
jgi:hypothetical protein